MTPFSKKIFKILGITGLLCFLIGVPITFVVAKCVKKNITGESDKTRQQFDRLFDWQTDYKNKPIDSALIFDEFKKLSANLWDDFVKTQKKLIKKLNDLLYDEEFWKDNSEFKNYYTSDFTSKFVLKYNQAKYKFKNNNFLYCKPNIRKKSIVEKYKLDSDDTKIIEFVDSTKSLKIYKKSSIGIKEEQMWESLFFNFFVGYKDFKFSNESKNIINKTDIQNKINQVITKKIDEFKKITNFDILHNLMIDCYNSASFDNFKKDLNDYLFNKKLLFFYGANKEFDQSGFASSLLLLVDDLYTKENNGKINKIELVNVVDKKNINKNFSILKNALMENTYEGTKLNNKQLVVGKNWDINSYKLFNDDDLDEFNQIFNLEKQIVLFENNMAILKKINLQFDKLSDKIIKLFYSYPIYFIKNGFKNIIDPDKAELINMGMEKNKSSFFDKLNTFYNLPKNFFYEKTKSGEPVYFLDQLFKDNEDFKVLIALYDKEKEIINNFSNLTINAKIFEIFKETLNNLRDKCYIYLNHNNEVINVEQAVKDINLDNFDKNNLNKNCIVYNLISSKNIVHNKFAGSWSVGLKEKEMIEKIDISKIYEKDNSYAKPINKNKFAFVLAKLSITTGIDINRKIIEIKNRIGKKTVDLCNIFLSEWNYKKRNRFLINKFKDNNLRTWKITDFDITYDKADLCFDFVAKKEFPTNADKDKIKEYLNNFIEDDKIVNEFLSKNAV